MIDFIQSTFSPYYIYIKFIHLLFVMIWAWSTAAAYVVYVRIAWNEWKKEPDNQALIDRRNWVFERFDDGAILEHIAFPVILITGPILFFSGSWSLDIQWLYYKLLIVVLLFIPIEIFDYWISHFGGNKTRAKKNGEVAYNKLMVMHGRFLEIISPIIVVTVLTVLFLAIVKPVF